MQGGRRRLDAGAQRPAWPKQIHIIDAIPLTSVGKIYKPQLRCDAAQRQVSALLNAQPGLEGVRVSVREGGRRGLQVQVSLPPAAHGRQAAVEQLLAGFLFEAQVRLA